MIRIRRIYEPGSIGENYKVLVDRLWPRGISKEKAEWDEWVKDLSPSNELRQWFSHDASKWAEFKRRYEEELAPRRDELIRLKQLEKKYGTLTMLYSSRNTEFNHALVLREVVMRLEA